MWGTTELPGFRPRDRLRLANANPRIDGDAPLTEPEHGIEIQLGDGRKILAEPAQTENQVRERARVGGRRTPEAGRLHGFDAGHPYRPLQVPDWGIHPLAG